MNQALSSGAPALPCRLLIVDDHQMLMQSLTLLLNEQPDLTVVRQLRSGTDLLAWLSAAATPTADLLLLDLHLPPPDGLTLLPQLRQYWPQLRVLVLSTAAAGPELIERIAASGARGFVSKSADADLLLTAIRAVHRGELAFPPRLQQATLLTVGATAEPSLRLQRLSKREREIVRLIRTGHTSRVIADHLSLSELTVATHRRNIMYKLELQNLASLVQFAIDHGL
ncbi:response regulator transcription factor [Hymenobacter sp. BT188]|uniref:response regulator n=1 Tax=Hymenobacter sp. BT188 TaxID=2763504 RepID=UPI001650F69D|nr:response regulator transcription factor [Hymenobacter sp. BT188]MBC6607885.1 response regulator transcription factor [Hymenobacter sp. BT188]